MGSTLNGQIDIYGESLDETRTFYIHTKSSVARDEYFQDKQDIICNWGLNTTKKMLVSVRLLAIGGSSSDTEHYFELGESTTLKEMLKFYTAMRELFGRHIYVLWQLMMS